MLDDIDLNAISEGNARELVRRLLNLIEQLTGDLRASQAEVQRLRDEVNRLKGEQGKPKIKGNTEQAPRDHSSEEERKQPRQHQKKSKKGNIRIDREQVAEVDKSTLPADAEFKGYETVVVQDIELKTDNILFHKEKYYSASTRQTYLAELPAGYEGQFGPGIKALSLVMYYGMNTSEPKIVEFLDNIGIRISTGEISNLLIKGQESFHAEKHAICEAGLRSSPWQHVDDTQTRVDGKNQHCHIICNPVYTAYHTYPSKARLTVLDVLRNGRERSYRLNRQALAYLETTQLSQANRAILQSECSEQDQDESTFLSWLDERLPGLNAQHRKTVIDAAAIAAYHAETGAPVLQALVCDDAPQFKWLTDGLMLCWVHEGRLYKKLIPAVALHRKLLDDFLRRFWLFYDKLLAYRQSPTPEEAQRLEAEFDSLFATRTGYDALDNRIALTQAKKDNLLLVLKHPELPLHNNPAELGARQRVRKRDVSFGPRTSDGVRAWDTFMTLAATTKKLNLSFYHYIDDRIRQKNHIPSLDHLVTQVAQELHLGWSWP